MAKKYDKEFKLQTVQMIEEERKAVAQVARELGIKRQYFLPLDS
jgi:transposase